MRKLLAFAAFAGILVLAHAIPASASVSATPAKVEIRAERGAETTFTVTISSDENQVMGLAVSTWDFARDSQGRPQRVASVDSATFRGCAEWLTPQGVADSLVTKGEDMDVPVVVRVPEDALWGSHSAYLQLKTMPPGVKSGVAISYALNVLVVVTVEPASRGVVPRPGTVEAGPVLSRRVEIAEVAVPSLNMNGAVPLRAVLTNTGNVHADVRARFDIVQGGRVVGSVPLNAFTLLPGDRFPITAEWSRPPLLGKYDLRFVAEVADGSPLTKAASLWVISWTAIGIVCGVLGVLGVALMLVRKYVHIEIRRTAPHPETS